jgi:hypothetical protein
VPDDSDTLTGPHTEPYTPIFDTGALAVALEPVGPPAAPALPTAVPGSYQYLKHWTFVLVVAAVWFVAAAIGLALFYWWYQSVDKTPAVFVVFVYLIACTVGGLLTAMVQNRPIVAAAAIALMSAPLASTAAAAALYGAYFFEWIAR